ncbi:MAG TPA: hypothetical protein PLI19_02215 [Erysipelotrichaceae bacterium]|nr:hypothetical protein [Erysipelotrichaceae bacterium]
MFSKALNKWYRLCKSKEIIPILNELENNQYLPFDEIRNLQMIRLSKILEIAIENVPYYENLKKEKKHLFSKDCSLEQILREFPILTKKELIDNYDNLINPNCMNKVFENYSGGSTGNPVRLLQDSLMRDYGLAAAMRSDRWAGWDFGSSVFKFWGASRDLSFNRKEKIKRVLLNEYLFDAFSWDEKIIKNIYKLMGRRKPEIIISYASALYFYVITIKKMGLKANHKPKGIITSADMLYDWQRKEIEEYFNCKIFNRYGCRELGLIACECEEHNGLHISSDRIYIEIVDENGHSLPEGEVGRILLTDLTNTAMPIIRYEIGDIGVISKDQICKCGRGLQKLEFIDGRVTDFIISTEGKYVSGTALTTVIPRLKNIQQIQIIQEEKGKIIVKAIKDINYSDQDELHMKNILQEYLGIDIEIKFEYVLSLLNEKTGKYRFVINEMK